MKVLLMHAHYSRQGGEDIAFANESRLLEEAAHEVRRLELSNRDYARNAVLRALEGQTVGSRDGCKQATRAIMDFGPDVVHVHNTFPFVGPAFQRAARKCDVPLVATIHNYRPSCLNGQHFREGAPCIKCTARQFKWPGIVHRCYRNSITASGLVGIGRYLDHIRRKRARAGNTYIALTGFQRTMMIAEGIPPEDIFLKGNFSHDSAPPNTTPDLPKRYILYAGRISPEKGLATLVDALCAVKSGSGMHLLVAGEGPDRSRIESRVRVPRVHFLGHRPSDEVRALMSKADALVIPSIWFEGQPLAAVEALAAGCPLIVSRIGALPDMIGRGTCGWEFPPGDAIELGNIIQTIDSAPEVLVSKKAAARRKWQDEHSPSSTLTALERIYGHAIKRHGCRA